MDITNKNNYVRLTPAARILLGSSIALGLNCAALAGDWQVTPQFTAREVYTDNFSLDTDDIAEDDFITELTPGINIYRQTGRLTFNLDYALQNIMYADHGSAGDNLHLLEVASRGEIFKDHGFLDIGATLAPQNVDPAGKRPIDNLSATGDRANVFDYFITPSWIQPISNVAVAEGRYTYDDLSSDSDNVDDSYSHRGTFTLRNGRRFTDWLWNANYDERRINTEGGGGEVLFREYGGRAHYLVNRRWGVIGELGYEHNDFVGATDEVSGLSWGVGFSWRPMTNTSLEVVGGERFYGKSFRGSLNHTGRHFRWVATYEEDPTTFSEILAVQQVFTPIDPFTGLPQIDPVTGQPLQLNQVLPTLTAEVLLVKRFATAMDYTAKRHEFRLSFVDENRDYQVAGTSDSTRTVLGGWTWNFSPKTSSILQLQWVRDDFVFDRQDDIYLADLVLTRKLSRDFDVSLGGRHLQRDSSDAAAEYSENRAMVMLVKTWK